MGVNFQRLNKWLNKPTWGDFIVLMIGWTLTLGALVAYVVFTTDERSMWLTLLLILLLVVLHVAMFVGDYHHVKSHMMKHKHKNIG